MTSVSTSTHDDHVLNNIGNMTNFLTELPTLKVPNGFTDVLESFAREVLRDQPDDLVQFAIDYFGNELDKRPGRKAFKAMKTKSK